MGKADHRWHPPDADRPWPTRGARRSSSHSGALLQSPERARLRMRRFPKPHRRVSAGQGSHEASFPQHLAGIPGVMATAANRRQRLRDRRRGRAGSRVVFERTVRRRDRHRARQVRAPAAHRRGRTRSMAHCETADRQDIGPSRHRYSEITPRFQSAVERLDRCCRVSGRRVPTRRASLRVRALPFRCREDTTGSAPTLPRAQSRAAAHGRLGDAGHERWHVSGGA